MPLPAVSRWLPWVWSLALSILMLGPALAPGYVLTYDMVWVPDLAFRSDFLGLGSALPRAVPSDAIVSVVDELIPGMVLQKLVLLGSLVLAGVGAARLLPSDRPLAGLAASSLYIWNPYVAERLAIGHWPLLMTVAALPWVLLAARQLPDARSALARIVLWVAFASLSPAGGVLATLFAVGSVVAWSRRRARDTFATLAGCLMVNAPWIVAGALHGGGAVSDPDGVAVFSARGEGWLPLLPTLVGLGGIWNGEVVPASRAGWPALATLVVVGLCWAAGFATWRRATPRPEALVLIGSGVLGLAVGLAGSLAPESVAWWVAHIPGGGLIRDGARFLALLAPLAAVVFGWGVSVLVGAVRWRVLAPALGAVLLLAPAALMPDAGAGLSGRLRAVAYPAEFDIARTALEERTKSASGDLLVLPFSSYRRPDWNDGRRTLDPVGRFMTPNYLASDVLVVSGREVEGEDKRAARVAALLTTETGPDLDAALRGEGIRWVVLDLEAQAAIGSAAPTAEPSGRVVHEGPRLVVWELPGPVAVAERPLRAALMVLAWMVAVATVVVLLGAGVRNVMQSRARMRSER